MPLMTTGTECTKYPNLWPAATNSQGCKGRDHVSSSRCEDMSQSCKQVCIAALTTQSMSYRTKLCKWQGFCSSDCHMRHPDDESGYSSLSYTLLLCADLEMLFLNFLCVGTHPKQILQNLAKLAHANYGLMSTGFIFIHREARGRCCEKGVDRRIISTYLKN